MGEKKKTALVFLVTSISILFFIGFPQFTFPPEVYEGYLFFISSPTLIISYLFRTAILSGVRCYFIMDLICISMYGILQYNFFFKYLYLNLIPGSPYPPQQKCAKVMPVIVYLQEYL